MYRGVAQAGILGARPVSNTIDEAQLLRKSKRRGAHHTTTSCEHGPVIGHFELSPRKGGPLSLQGYRDMCYNFILWT